MRVRIYPSKISGTVAAPPSKSYTHRAVILASLAEGETIIDQPLLSDDTLCTIEACRVLGAEIILDDNKLRIKGTAGHLKSSDNERILTGSSGSTIRMLAPLAALTGRKIVLDGTSQLRQRPMNDLLTALNSLGIEVCSINNNGRPPLEIRGGRFSGGEVEIDGSVSSQYISALLMSAPYTEKGITINITGILRSRPYVDMTIAAMRDFGIGVKNNNYRKFSVKGGQKYKARRYQIEGDYSQAAYFLAAGAIGGGPVSISNLKTDSAQGDRYILSILSSMGCSVVLENQKVTVSRKSQLKGITLDMSDYPDIVQTAAVVAAYARGDTIFNNIGHLRFKESDRITNTAAELKRLGVDTEASENSLIVHGGQPAAAEIDSHHDHRMAMSFSIAALFAKSPSVINGAEAVNKSYPQFFNALASLGARIEKLP